MERSATTEALRSHDVPAQEGPTLPVFTKRELEEIHRKLGIIMTRGAMIRDFDENLPSAIRTAGRTVSREAREVTAILQDRLRLMVDGGIPTPIELILLDIAKSDEAQEPVRV